MGSQRLRRKYFLRQNLSLIHILLRADSLLSIGVNEVNVNSLNGSIYPNPANEKITISFINREAKSYSIEITNIVGQVVFDEQNLNDCSFPVTFKTVDVSKLEAGTYLVSIKANNKQLQKKIIITR